MNTKEFEKLVEKLRETLVDEPTTDTGKRSDYIVRASEGNSRLSSTLSMHSRGLFSESAGSTT